MEHSRHKAGTDLRQVLRRAGLLGLAQRLMRPYRLYHSYRSLRPHHERVNEFARRHGEILGHPLKPETGGGKTAVVSSVHFPEVEIEFVVLKALELAGFSPVLLIERDDWLLRRYYKLANVRAVHAWGEFADAPQLDTAERLLAGCRSFDDMLEIEHAGARVGLFAASTAMRRHRLGSIDLSVPQDRELLLQYLGKSIAYAEGAVRILDRYRPELAVFVDKGYSPKGELFDHCQSRDIDCVSWDLAHKSSTLTLKRCTPENRDTNVDGISSASWETLQNLDLTDAHRQELDRELFRCYASGDWYSVVGTQFNKKLLSPDELRERLGLDPSRKNAFVFPHVSWDATLFWGTSLFDDYEEWLVETVRKACANDRINWIVKIHPAHVGKAVREGFKGEPAEAVALRKHIGQLPSHVHLIPAESDISTYSLFPIMDYCITVRGRVGIEAARYGIPVLTSGTGAYDGRGFTVDSATREEYLDRLARLESQPPLSPEQQQLAERFAYGFFIMRPLPLRSASLKYHESHSTRASRGQINIENGDDWRRAGDVRALAAWFTARDQEDFLRPPLPDADEPEPAAPR